MDKIKFRETLTERIKLTEELLEQVEYLSYDINPTGCGDHMFGVMYSNAIEQIEEIQNTLSKIKENLILNYGK